MRIHQINTQIKKTKILNDTLIAIPSKLLPDIFNQVIG